MCQDNVQLHQKYCFKLQPIYLTPWITVRIQQKWPTDEMETLLSWTLCHLADNCRWYEVCVCMHLPKWPSIWLVCVGVAAINATLSRGAYISMWSVLCNTMMALPFCAIRTLDLSSSQHFTMKDGDYSSNMPERLSFYRHLCTALPLCRCSRF